MSKRPKATTSKAGAAARKQARANAPECDQRFARFAKLYVEGEGEELRPGNALQAALKAGYPPAYAKGHSWELAAKVRVKMGQALRAQGINEVRIARKLDALLDAKTPKWNQTHGRWDRFEDSGTQIAALDRAVELLELAPPKKVKGELPDGAIPIRLVSSIPRPQRQLADA